MLGTSPKVRITTASSNSPVAGSPLRENATAPANVQRQLVCEVLRGGRALAVLRFTWNKLAFLVPDESQRHIVGHRHGGSSSLQAIGELSPRL